MKIAQHETIAHAAASALFSPAAAIWLSAIIAHFLLQCRCHLHPLRRTRLYRHGAGRHLLQAHGDMSSQVANSGIQFDRAGGFGGDPHIERSLWSPLYLCDVHDGAVIHTHRGRTVYPSLEATRYSSSLSLHRISLAAGIYVLIGAAWTLNTIVTRPKESLIGTLIVLLGVPCYLYWKKHNRKIA